MNILNLGKYATYMLRLFWWRSCALFQYKGSLSMYGDFHYKVNTSIMMQCMKWPVAHSPNSTWFWLELVGNCCERLKIIMKYTNIQFCERLGHGWQFHLLMMGIPILVRWHLYNEMGAWSFTRALYMIFEVYIICSKTNGLFVVTILFFGMGIGLLPRLPRFLYKVLLACVVASM